MNESIITTADIATAEVSKMADVAANEFKLGGRYHAICHNKHGDVMWEDDIFNLVTTLGKQVILEAFFRTAYTPVQYMGLGGNGIVASANIADTMASHAGWLEVGNANAPQYTAPRKTLTFAAASGGSIASTGTYTFSIITTGGTVGGCFVVVNTNATASSTIDNTGGVLYSAGGFSGGAKTVAVSDTVTVTYTATAA